MKFSLKFCDYLDGCDIFDGFSDLNLRFQNLLSSCLMFKIKNCSLDKSVFQRYCTHIIIPNKHRIISLHIMNSNLNILLFEFTADALFIRLESLVLYRIPSNRLRSLFLLIYILYLVFIH